LRPSGIHVVFRQLFPVVFAALGCASASSGISRSDPASAGGPLNCPSADSGVHYGAFRCHDPAAARALFNVGRGAANDPCHCSPPPELPPDLGQEASDRNSDRHHFHGALLTISASAAHRLDIGSLRYPNYPATSMLPDVSDRCAPYLKQFQWIGEPRAENAVAECCPHHSNLKSVSRLAGGTLGLQRSADLRAFLASGAGGSRASGLVP
jgi:hypothetical protein